MNGSNRRQWIQAVSAASLGTWATAGGVFPGVPSVFGAEPKADSLPMQLYKSLTPEQRQKVCLPADHPRRKYVSNWWYILPEHRIPSTFDAEQQELIKKIFDSLPLWYVEFDIFHAVLESAAAEHAARMTAMDAASKNAGDVIDSLTLHMNKVRQAAITREIIEVVSGAQAL